MATSSDPGPTSAARMDTEKAQLANRPARLTAQEAIRTISRRRPRTTTRTIVLKLRTRSRRKEHALLAAQRHATAMAAAILEDLREDPFNPRDDGAFQLIGEMLAQRAAQETAAKPTVLLASALSKRYKDQLTTRDYPLSGTLREGVYRDCARTLYVWYRKVQGYAIGPLGSVPSAIVEPRAADIQAHWTVQWQIYEHAASTLVPLGRHRGETLRQAGKRNIRWLRDRLPDDPTIRATLHHLDVLLHEEQHSRTERATAKRALHPWRRRPRQERAVRAPRLLQHRFDESQPLVRLGTLSDAEKWALWDELHEMQQFAEEFAAIRAAVDLYLAPQPPGYPRVEIPARTPEEAEKRQHDYEQALEWFQGVAPRKRSRTGGREDVAAHLAELEADARARLLEAARMVSTEDLQPLTFVRSIRPKSGDSKGRFDSFALLYNRETYEYVLALVIQGAQANGHFTPHVGLNLYYVNFPQTPFQPPRSSSIMLVPLECGRAYHDEQFLRTAIEVQRDKQHHQHVQRGSESDRLPIEECLPRSAFGFARLISRIGTDGFHDFYLHVPVTEAVPRLAATPTHFLGVHEHKSGYTYAVITPDGQEVIAGELPIPTHVAHCHDTDAYSNNYVFEVAHAVIRLARDYDAVIGLEDASWQRRPTLSRRQNRRAFGRPRRKLIETLAYKVPLAGLVSSYAVHNVSPSRDCGSCGHRLPPGSSGLQVDAFVCRQCQTRRLATENTALVVARRTIEQVVNHAAHIATSKHEAANDEEDGD